MPVNCLSIALVAVGIVSCGKSTLVNLLLRLWEVDSGVITLNNTDARIFHADTLSSFYSVVSQDAYMFNRTLRESLKKVRLLLSRKKPNDFFDYFPMY